MTDAPMSTEEQLAVMRDRAEGLGKMMHYEGFTRHNPNRYSWIAELRGLIDKAYQLGQELHGGEFTDGAGPDELCGCGETITWFEGVWMHIANEELRGTGDHPATPQDGFYNPDRVAHQSHAEPDPYCEFCDADRVPEFEAHEET